MQQTVGGEAAELKALYLSVSQFAQAFDPNVVSGADATLLHNYASRIEGVAATIKAIALLRVDETDAYKSSGHRSAADYGASKTGTSSSDALRAMKRAKNARRLPKTEEAMRSGDISPQQADAITDAARVNPDAEDDLLEAAKTDDLNTLRRKAKRAKSSADQDAAARTRRIHANRSFTHWLDDDGAFCAMYRNTPEAGARFLARLKAFERAAFERARKEGRREAPQAYAADAFDDLISATGDADSNADSRATTSPTSTTAHSAARPTPAEPAEPTEPTERPEPFEHAATTPSPTPNAGDPTAPAPQPATGERAPSLFDEPRPGQHDRRNQHEPPLAGPHDTPSTEPADDTGDRRGNDRHHEHERARSGQSSQGRPSQGQPSNDRSSPPGSPTGPPQQDQPAGQDPPPGPTRAKAPPPPVTAHLFVDLAALQRGNLEAGETCEIEGIGPIDLATARAMLGDANVKLLVKQGDDIRTVVHTGRSVTARQRSVLIARDPCCIVPGCGRTHNLEIDHRTGWAITETTSLDDLARLCRWHHHLKTHCGYTYVGGPGTWQWLAPHTHLAEAG